MIWKTPSGMPASTQQFGAARRRQRDLFGRLEDERVAAGDGERVHPHRHHGGKVERRDSGADAQRLAHGTRIDAARNVVQGIAHHEAGHAAGDFDHLDGAAHFGAGVVRCLAVFRGEDGRNFVGVLFEQRLKAIERLHAIHHRCLAPCAERSVGGAHGAVYFGSGSNGRRAISSPVAGLKTGCDEPPVSTHWPLMSECTVFVSVAIIPLS